MPISLSPISRRRFLSASVAAGVGLVSGCTHDFRSEKALDANRVALLSDTHIHFDPEWYHDGKVNTWLNFEKVTGHILAEPSLPSMALVCGDCVYLQGRYDDYLTLQRAMAPLRRQGMAIHLALGNHDRRENFREVMPIDAARQAGVEDRHMLLVSTPLVDWHMLDSLVVTNETPGSLGEKQLACLAKSLDARPNKPAIIMVHHDPEDPAGTTSAATTKPAKITGLVDTKGLLDVILSRKNVKACIYGHTHIWQHVEREGLHFVNLPPTAWVFSASRPNGYVAADLRADGASFQLHTLEEKHPQNGQMLDLKWR